MRSGLTPWITGIVLFVYAYPAYSSVVSRCFTADNATDDATCSSVTIELGTINATTDYVENLRNAPAGPRSTIEFKTMLAATEESNDVLLSMFYGLFQETVATMSSDTSISEVIHSSVTTRPDLASELTRASLFASPSPIIAKDIAHGLYKSFIDQSSELGEDNFVDALSVLLEFASTQVPSSSWKPAVFVKMLANQPNVIEDVKAVAGRSSLESFRPALLRAVQSRAEEVKVQSFSRNTGGTLTVGSIVSIDIPARAIPDTGSVVEEPVVVHVYDCTNVRRATTDVSSSSASNKCIGITPHQFEKPITVSFQAAPDVTRCMKISDEASVDWTDFECHISDTGWVTYKTSTLSVLTAERQLGYQYDPHPDRKVLFAELPDIVEPSFRFTRKQEAIRSGKYEEFLVPKGSEKQLARDVSMDTSLLGFEIDTVSGLLYWSDGMRILSAHWRHRLDQTRDEPVLRVPGAIRVHVRGENFGKSLSRVRGVTISISVQQKYMCVPTILVSSSELYCEIQVTRDARLLKIARRQIKRSNTVVSLINQHQLTVENAPKVKSVEVDTRGRSPRALCLDVQTRWLYWVEATLGEIRRTKLGDVADRAQFGHVETVVSNLHGSDIKSLSICRTETSSKLAWLQTNLGVLQVSGNIPDDMLSQPVDFSVTIQGLRAPHGLAIVKPEVCSMTSPIVFTEEGGRIYRARLDGQPINVPTGRLVLPGNTTNRRLLKTFKSQVRLTGIDVLVDPTTQEIKMYWAESGTNRIMSSSIKGTASKQILGPNDYITTHSGGGRITWPRNVLVRDQVIYWSEYLGEICMANLDGSNPVALLERDFSVASKSIVDEVENLQTRGIEYSIETVD